MDPIQEQVLLLTLSDGNYQEELYQGDRLLQSSMVPEVEVSANQLFRPGKSPNPVG